MFRHVPGPHVPGFTAHSLMSDEEKEGNRFFSVIIMLLQRWPGLDSFDQKFYCSEPTQSKTRQDRIARQSLQM